MDLVDEDENVDHLFTVFKDLADRKKEMTDDDLVSIVLENKISKTKQYYQLINIQIQSGESSRTYSNSYAIRPQ